MPFTYRAVRADGSEQLGELQATTRSTARDQLVAAGLFPVEIRTVNAPLGRRERVPIADLAVGLRLLSSLLGAGLPLERALGIFQHVAPPTWGESRISSLRGAVREGTSFATALRNAGLGVPAHVSGIIDAGESGGTLVEALREVATLVEQAAEQRAAIQGALAYPAILAVAGVAAVSLLVGIVLPRFAVLLTDVGQQLPPSARLLLALSSLAERWWWLLLGGPLVVGAWLMHHLATDTNSRRRLLDGLLVLPIVGPLRHATAGARLTSALASMLGTGVPLASALAHASQASGDEAIAGRVMEARDAVIGGERLSQAFADVAAVRPSVLQLIKAGEASGELGEMLRTSARIETEWSLGRIRMLTRLIEPSLILCFGGVIAFVAAALLQAVYSIRPTP